MHSFVSGEMYPVVIFSAIFKGKHLLQVHVINIKNRKSLGLKFIDKRQYAFLYPKEDIATQGSNSWENAQGDKEEKPF